MPAQPVPARWTYSAAVLSGGYTRSPSTGVGLHVAASKFATFTRRTCDVAAWPGASVTVAPSGPSFAAAGPTWCPSVPATYETPGNPRSVQLRPPLFVRTSGTITDPAAPCAVPSDADSSAVEHVVGDAGVLVPVGGALVGAVVAAEAAVVGAAGVPVSIGGGGEPVQPATTPTASAAMKAAAGATTRTGASTTSPGDPRRVPATLGSRAARSRATRGPPVDRVNGVTLACVARSARDGTPPRWLRPVNRLVVLLNRAGVAIESGAVLTVPGRRTGRPQRVPVSPLDLDGRRYLLAGFPTADWPRNVRAAGGRAELAVGRRSRAVRLVELDPAAAEPVLRAWPDRIPGGTKVMVDAGVVAEASPDAFAALAGRCAVFRVEDG